MSKTTVLVAVGSVVLSVAALFGGVLVGDAMSHDVEPRVPEADPVAIAPTPPTPASEGSDGDQIGAGAAGGGAEAAGSAPAGLPGAVVEVVDDGTIPGGSAERMVMTDPERRAEDAESGAEPFVPPVPEDAVDEAAVREAASTGGTVDTSEPSAPGSSDSAPGSSDSTAGGSGGSAGAGDSSGDAGGADGEMAVIDPIFDMGDTPQIRFFDSCADGADDCPDGVGGTVLFPWLGAGFTPDLFADFTPFKNYYDDTMLDGPRWLTSCDVAPNADATEALFFHTTNKPADDVIVTYDSPDAPGGTATIHTGPAPGEVERWESLDPADPDHLRRDRVEYCTKLTGLDPSATHVSIGVEYHRGDEVVYATTTSYPRGAFYDGDRPALQLVPRGPDHALAIATHRSDEQVYLAAIPSTGPDATDENCASIREAVVDRSYRGPGILATPRLLARSDPEDEYRYQTLAGVWPEEGLTYTVCAYYVGPEDRVEQVDEIEFTAPNRQRIRVFVTGLHTDVDLPAQSWRPFPTEWRTTADELDGALLPSEDLGAGDDEAFGSGRLLYDSGARPVPAMSVFQVDNDALSPRAVNQAVLPTPTSLCSGPTESDDPAEVVCLAGYSRTHRVEVMGLGRGSDLVPVGWIDLRIETYDGPGAEDRDVGDNRFWTIQGSGRTNGRDIDAGRLVGSDLELTGPTEVTVRLRASRAVEVNQISLGAVTIDDSGCPVQTQRQPEAAISHEFVFADLCPGTTYRAEYVIADPDHPTRLGTIGTIETAPARTVGIRPRHLLPEITYDGEKYPGST